ncbi:MAG TPA: cation:proton antiporter [Nitrospiraceae bacterium]|nr:cation:proton antiporter [Nitrospiraceae bacterium]
MTSIHVLSDLLVIFGISIAVVYVFQRLRLPSIAGFLAAGALIGPFGLNLVSDLEQVNVMAEIGVVLLLFTIGIEFSLAHLTAAGRLILVSGPLQVGSVLLLVTLIGRLIGLPYGEAMFWGCLLSLSSTAIVLKALADRGEADSPHGRVTVSILIFQDLAVVPMMLLTPLMASRSGGATTELLLVLAKSVVLVGIIVAGAWFVVPRLLEQIVRSRSRELFLLTIIVLCLGIGLLTSISGLSLALGAFIAGLVISESEYSHQAMAEVLPFRDSFNSLFFVSIGMLMDVRVVLEHPLLVIALVGAVLIGKFVTSAGPVLAAGQPLRTAVLSGIALAQVGEFGFILAQEGQSAELLSETAYQLFLAVSVLTMVLTPFLIQGAPKVARRAEAVQRLRHWFPSRPGLSADRGGSRHLRIKDHVIVVGYGLNGRNLSRVLEETEIPYVVLDLDGETVRRETKNGVAIYYGDATNPTVLRHARIDDARVLVIAISDPFSARRTVQIARGLNPSLHIIVRTRYLRELDELHQLGADEVVPEEFETSIEIFALVLRTYKMPQDFIVHKAEQVRREGYALLRRSSSLPELAHHLRGGTLTDVEVETCRIEPDSPSIGKTLAQMSVRPRTGASVIALTRGGVTESNPLEKTVLKAGDVVVLLGSRDQIQRAIGLLDGS